MLTAYPPAPFPNMPNAQEIAGTVDRRDRPAYRLTEAAHYVRLPRATLASWVQGRDYDRRDGRAHFDRLIRPADPRRPYLSFNNLIEAHVLRALRAEHQVSIQAVRAALAVAEQEYRIDRLLLHDGLLTGAGELFLKSYGDLVHLSPSGQIAMRRVLASHLHRIDRDGNFPIRLHPFVQSDVSDAKPIVIDPAVGFGRPIVARTGISTATIAERIDAGESVAEVAADYGMQTEEIADAVTYERAA